MTEADMFLEKYWGEILVEKIKLQHNSEALLKKTQVDCKTMKVEAEQIFDVFIKYSESELNISERNTLSMIARGKPKA